MAKKYEEEDNMMEFVPEDDAIPEIGEEPKEELKPEEKPKKERKNVFKRAWSGIKWIGRKVRESPAATVIGGLAGSAMTFGGIALYEGRKAKRYAQLEIEGDTADPEMEELIKMENESTEEPSIDPLEEDNVVDEAV